MGLQLTYRRGRYFVRTEIADQWPVLGLEAKTVVAEIDLA
jgi:hypothetical protein